MGLLNVPNEFTAGTTARASEVNANFAAIEAVLNGNVDDTNLANSAVTTSKLADGAVTEPKYANASIPTAALQNDSVTGPKVAEDAIDTEHLALEAVDNNALAPEAVTESKLADGAVTESKLANASVGLEKLKSDVTDILDLLDGLSDPVATLLGDKADASHVSDTDNPHNVNAAQAGAITDGNGTGQTLYAGYWNEDASTTVLPDGWSVTKLSGDGRYSIDPGFNPPQGSIAISVTPIGVSASIPRMAGVTHGPSNNPITVETFTPSGTRVDTAVSFIIVTFE